MNPAFFAQPWKGPGFPAWMQSSTVVVQQDLVALKPGIFWDFVCRDTHLYKRCAYVYVCIYIYIHTYIHTYIFFPIRLFVASSAAAPYGRQSAVVADMTAKLSILHVLFKGKKGVRRRDHSSCAGNDEVSEKCNGQ